MSESRRSVAKSTAVHGVGLHTSEKTTVTFKPADVDQGVVFRRTDIDGCPAIRASTEHVQSTERRTCLGYNGATVETVEHLLAAVAALEIDDLVIDIDGPEVPIGDGNAATFLDALSEAGPTDIGGTPTYHRVTAPMVVREGDATYVLAPSDATRLTVTVEWDHPLIGRQSGCFDITPCSFEKDLARARTFGFECEADELHAKGLARGASQSNVVVLSEEGLIGAELVWPDEFVRHKTVDLLGDLALLGGRFKGEITAFRPSHKGNLALARSIERASLSQGPSALGIQEILGAIPHRYPMLFVDRILELEAGKRIVGIKNVTIDEPFFQGHFPEHPIMPGVLVVEAMAQVGGMLLMGAFDNPEDKVVYFMSIDNVKFRKPVVPGDQIRFELEMLHFRGRNCRMRGVGYVDGQPVAEAEMMARVVDK
ncbi:MAG: UDP-3-O-acyl-N-acetylglucosamine deacetylase [Gemmatimonadales bacterium]